MNQSLPVTIYKHWIGYVAIALLGVAVIGLVLGAFWAGAAVPGVDTSLLFALAVFAVALVAAATIITLYVYSLSYIELTQDGLVAVNWKSLFVKQDVQAEWVRVQDVSVVASGIFAQLLGYATLNIQTAGTTQATRMTMVPSADYWQQVIAYYADQATTDGMDITT